MIPADTAWFNRALWKQWILLTTVGLLAVLAFKLPLVMAGWNLVFGSQPNKGLVAFATVLADFSGWCTYAWLQATIVKEIYPTCQRMKWVFATSSPYLLLTLSALPSYFIYSPAANQPPGPHTQTHPAYIILASFFMGLLFSVPQWFLLKRFAKKAGVWILCQTVAFGVAGWILVLCLLPDPARFTVGYDFGFALGATLIEGVLVGVIGGLAFYKMQPLQTTEAAD
ncbi:MAG: hypothetical protein KF784_15645 [Fimbriimonadaceae bacterium]|nr:hypothetical protein [Fimbriimonadaceae bacterium]